MSSLSNIIFTSFWGFSGYLQLNLIGTNSAQASNTYIGYIYIKNTSARVAYTRFGFVKTMYIGCIGIYDFDTKVVDTKDTYI